MSPQIRRSRPRGRKEVRLQTMVTADLAERVEVLADRAGMSLSSCIRRLVEIGLAAETKARRVNPVGIG